MVRQVRQGPHHLNFEATALLSRWATARLKGWKSALPYHHEGSNHIVYYTETKGLYIIIKV